MVIFIVRSGDKALNMWLQATNHLNGVCNAHRERLKEYEWGYIPTLALFLQTIPIEKRI